MALVVGNPDISNELWQSALAALERKFSKPIFEMWIKPLRLVSLTGDELLLAVQNNFARDWVENRLKSQISEVLSEIFGTGVLVQFTVVPEAADGGHTAAAPAVPARLRSARPKRFPAGKSQLALHL